MTRRWGDRQENEIQFSEDCGKILHSSSSNKHVSGCPVYEHEGKKKKKPGRLIRSTDKIEFRITYIGDKEMVQRLRALAALVEDLGSTPSIHMTAHNHW